MDPKTHFGRQKQILSEADVVCSTCSGADHPLIQHMTFARVLLDEAAQATELSSLVPLMKMKPEACVTLVGDHRQLPPTISNVQVDVEGFGTSLFERMAGQGVQPYLLNIQYRMHPCISAFPSSMYYDGQIRSGIPGASRRPPQGIAWPVPEVPVTFLPVAGQELSEGGRTRGLGGTSWSNKSEVEAVQELLKSLCAWDDISQEDVGIITPYAAQARLLRRSLGCPAPGKRGTGGMAVEDVIIVSTVRANSRGNVGFVGDPRRLNVTLTRAKRGLVVVGCFETLSHDQSWGSWLHWAQERGLVAGCSATVPEAAEALTSLGTLTTQQLLNLGAASAGTLPLLWVNSSFDGQLPQPFGVWPRGLWEVPPHMNDRNLREPSRYHEENECSFLADLTLKHQAEAPPDEKQWKEMHCLPFLDAESSRLPWRAFYVPFGLSNSRNSFGSYCIYKRLEEKKRRYRGEAQGPFPSELEGEDCPVCFEEMSKAEDAAGKLTFCCTCGNNFHHDCIQRWQKASSGSCHGILLQSVSHLAIAFLWFGSSRGQTPSTAWKPRDRPCVSFWLRGVGEVPGRMTPVMSPKESSDKEDVEQSPSGSGQLCVGFRCHHCVCIIDEGQPVYMGRDASYCSADCRKRGRSVEYATLMGIKQIEEDVPYDSASMYSSLVSESTTTSSKKTVEEDAGRGHRVFRWILSAGIRHLNALAAGTELLRMGSFKTSVQPGWPACLFPYSFENQRMAELPAVLGKPFQAGLERYCRIEPPLRKEELKELNALLQSKGTLNTSKAKCIGKDCAESMLMKKSIPDVEIVEEHSSQQGAEENSAENLDVWVHSHFHAKGGQKKKALHALSKHKESGTGEPIVNVAKLRGAKARRSRSPTQTAASGVSAVERSMARRERISTVLRRAQLLHLEKRTEHALRLHLQNLDQCWMVMEAVAALAAVKRIQVFWGMAKADFAISKLEGLAALPWQSPAISCWPLRAQHLETLKARILLMQKEERKRQRHEAIWKEWKKLLRSLVVWVKFRLPLRKTRSIDTIKSFMEVSARSYMLRRTVKNFVKSVLMVQRALRHQAHIFRTVQKRILQQYVWATETQLLCDAFRMRRAEAAARIEAYMEDMKKSLNGRNFLVMDTLRMDPRDCEEITRQMLLNSVDAWWAQYRIYRSAEPISMQNWINWRQDFVRRPDALIWDPPEVLKYPEMSFSPQGYQWLHKEVETRLRERPEFRSLIGEGF
eukprot:s6_g16.t1